MSLEEINERMIDASVDGLGMLDATIRRMEAEVAELRILRDGLILLDMLNRVPVDRMAEACGVSVQAIYQARDRARARERLAE